MNPFSLPVGYVCAFLAALLVSSLGMNAYQRQSYKRLKAEDLAKVEQLVDANATFSTTLGNLKTSVAECQAGRIADQAATKAALAKRDTAQQKLTRDAATARSSLARELAGRCRSWAEQPSCGLPLSTPWSPTK